MGNNITSQFDRRFGRAGWFCLYDEEAKTVEFHMNDNLNANSGAGTKAAEKMVELNAGKVISGDFGPKAKDLLDKFNIQMVVLQDDNTTLEKIIQRLK
jgi:predicted Fe-Mo cluster-binding NifX family protein